MIGRGLNTNVNLGVGWRHPDGMLSVRAFVNNAFKIVYATAIQSSSGNNLRFYNNPRMVGARLRFDW